KRAATAEEGTGRGPHPGAAPHGARVQAGGDGGGRDGTRVPTACGATQGRGSSGRRREGKGRVAGRTRARRLAGARFRPAATAGVGRGGGRVRRGGRRGEGGAGAPRRRRPSAGAVRLKIT